MNKLDRQLDLEREMTGLGHRRVIVNVIEGRDQLNAKGEKVHKKSAREAEQESRTEYGQSLISHAVDVVGAAVHQFIEETGADRRSLARATFRQFYPVQPTILVRDGETLKTGQVRLEKELVKWEQDKLHHARVIAFIALQSLVDALTAKKTHTRASVLIGRGLEDELRFRHFAKTNPALWDKVFRDLERRESNLERRRAVLIHSMKTDETKKASTFVAWEDSQAVLAGAKLIDLIKDTTDLVHVKMLTPRKHSRLLVIEPTDATMAFMAERIDSAGIRMPVFLPALCTPKKWVHPMTGGYYSSFKELKPIRMVKVAQNVRGVAHLRRLFDERERMPLVYRALNAVQATPWKINKPVLAVLQQAWQAGGLKIGKMPQKTDVTSLASAFPLEPYHDGLKQDDERYRSWKRKRAKVYKSRVEQCSRVLQMEYMAAMAEKFVNEPTIYFPTQLDFRGRMYAMPSFLNPQGTDVAKGLLTFARGCKLGASGWKWLHIHVANMFGEDKISFDDREAWTVENYHWLVDCVHAPFKHREWMQADKPWQFLAGAIELVAAVESGDYENFFSHLPVTVDGTCNGLQHFSAMLLDAEGAVSVNLEPSETPHDIYQIVADKVKAKFIQMDDPLARAWLEWGFDRKATKRSVMILPYSGTLHAAKQYIRDYVKERDDKCPWEDDFAATAFFAKHVWSTILETVQSAGTVMKWLRQVAKTVTAAKRTLQWTTPLNFLVEQDNRDKDQYRVDIMLGQGMRYQPSLERESERLDKNAQVLGISPNFVHSLDAACLMLTVNRALDEGIEDFAMVHDSYGVLAGKMDTLYMGLRQAFVDIYQGDVMGDFLKTTTEGLPEDAIKKLRDAMPKKGTFELESVKDSAYFFT
jgi:DNA-directed RNA polymerase